MNEGHYEEALQRHIWYHNHEREFGDSYQNVVRITSALSDWVELGRRYPKAKEALIEIRDQDTHRLADGKGYADLFTDVQAINRELGDDDATYVLFKTIREKDPKLAQQCYFWVENLLVAKGEYQWCYDHMGDPQVRFDQLKRTYNTQLSFQRQMAETQQRTKQMIAETNRKNGWTNTPFSLPPDTSAGIKKASVEMFVSQVRQLIEILVATGHKADAETIRDKAITILDAAQLQSAVSDAEQKIGSKHPAAAVFGPVIECELPFEGGDTPGLHFVGFKSGRVITLSLAALAPGTPEALENWMHENEADAVAEFNTDGSARLFGFKQCLFIESDTNVWMKTTAQQLNALWADSEGHAETRSATANSLPDTFLFKTHEGVFGLGQITGFTENPRGVKIRYKLMQNGGN